MLPLAALPLLAMGCFGNVLRSVCGRSSKLVDRSVLSTGAEILSHVVPKAFDKFVSTDSSRKRFAILKSLALALDSYRHSYTVSAIARSLRGVESFSSLRDCCREAGYTVGNRIGDLGKFLASAWLTIVDYDLLVLNVVPRLGLWGFVREASRHSEVEELKHSISILSAGIALAAEAWSRSSKEGNRALKTLENELSELVDAVDSLLDTVAILLDPENEVIAKEVIKVREA